MMFIPIVYYIVFRYIPMFGNIIAFRRYRAGSSIFGDEWSGLKYFNQFMKDQNFWRAFKNTLLLNFKYLIISFPLTLIFALLLNEVKNVHFKKIVQTISYLPHFISMVIVAGMVREILSTSGPINNLITKLGGEAITFISLPEWFTTIFVTTGVWQGLGWGTILYLAAMSGINTELYEAAELDGANRFQQCLHVTIPAILPTISTLLVLNIGSLCGSAAFEKVFLLYTPPPMRRPTSSPPTSTAWALAPATTATQRPSACSKVSSTWSCSRLPTRSPLADRQRFVVIRRIK